MESGPSYSSSATLVFAEQVESHFHRGFHSAKNRLSIFLLKITISSRCRLQAKDSGLQVGTRGERLRCREVSLDRAIVRGFPGGSLGAASETCCIVSPLKSFCCCRAPHKDDSMDCLLGSFCLLLNMNVDRFARDFKQ